MVLLNKLRRKRWIIFQTFTLKAIVSVVCIALLVSACGIGIAESDASEVFLLAEARKIPIYSVDTQEKIVGISFDAAYGSDKTEKILEILDGYNAKATFFLVGFWVDKYPELTKQISDKGHEIGTHSNMHEHMSKMSASDINTDLRVSVKKIEEVTGKKVDLFRPPYGEYDNKLMKESEKLGLFSIQWSVDSLDWKGISANEITTRVVSRIHEGAIVLFHNNSDNILEALPTVLELLSSRGYKFKTIGEMIYREKYKIDNNGKQIKLPD